MPAGADWEVRGEGCFAWSYMSAHPGCTNKAVHELGLQPRKPRSRDARRGSAPAWLCAYLFMLNGLVFVIGHAAGGGWRSLLPRRTDMRDGFRMLWYYIGLPVAKLTRRSWPHPRFDTKYNALQRVAYFSVVIAGLLSVLTGGRFTKPCSFIG
jgi:hypothetical protein